jgi:glycosyltransferase involved in cell wall biosynthesis
MPKIIFLTSKSPYPTTTPGRIRDHFLLTLLKEHGDVEVLCFTNRRGGADIPNIREGVRITFIQVEEKRQFWRRAFTFLRPTHPRFSQTMAEALRLRAKPGTILWISRLRMATYIPLARALGYRITFDDYRVEHDHSLTSRRALLRQRSCLAADAVVVSSDLDASRLQKMVTNIPIHVIPNTVDSHIFKNLRTNAGQTLFYPANFYSQNSVKNLNWFCNEIMPRLHAALGDQTPRIVVAGAGPLPAINWPGIEIHPHSSSILPFLSEAAIIIMPLRSEDNARSRILEAMAAGKAVVSTGKALSGLILSPSHDIWIADQADAFASAILRLLREPELRLKFGQCAAQTIDERYDWRALRTRIHSLLHEDRLK